MTFEEWFETHDWWKENSAEERLEPVWEQLSNKGLHGTEIGELLDNVIHAMRDEYGD